MLRSIPSLIVNDDKEMLEDLIAAAVNDANRRVDTETQEKMAGLSWWYGFAARYEIAFLVRQFSCANILTN